MTNSAKLYDALVDAMCEIQKAATYDSVRVEKALAHLAPFFAQGVHPGTPERSDHVAENHGTDDLELLKVVGLAQRIIDAVDQQLESEFGGFYLSAPDDEPLGKVRRMLRGEVTP